MLFQVLQKALANFVGPGNYKNLRGSSRTDAGVHAICNRFHVDICRERKVRGSKATESAGETRGDQPSESACELHMPPYDSDVVVKALNFYADNPGLRVLRARTVCPSFNATKCAKGRSYMYRLAYNPMAGKGGGSSDWVLGHCGLWVVDSGLDISLMRQAAQLFLGEADFSAVRNSGCQNPNPIKTITSLVINEYSSSDGAKDLLDAMMLGSRRLITIEISANAFLYRMVRNIVGILVKVGDGTLTLDDVGQLLAKRSRRLCPAPAPADGLYLVHVHYDEELDDSWEVCRTGTASVEDGHNGGDSDDNSDDSSDAE